MTNKPEQNSRDILRQKLAEQFPGEDQAQLLALLNQYESESAAGRLRVQLAVLKLSEGNLSQLRKYLEVARTDYRDVLFWAETPERAKAAGERIVQSQRREAQDNFRRYVILLLVAALLFIAMGARLTTTLGERVVMTGIFLLVGVLAYWRIQTGRL
jgi:hypothetical protein